MMNGTEGVGDREDLIGRATGAMVMALFGLLWALGCAGVLVAGALGPILLASSAVVTAILVAASLRLRRAAQRALPSETRSSRRAAVPAHADLIRWRFRLVGVVQGLGIGIAVFACVRFGRPELIPAAAALIVGLHFFPLAPLFRVPLYYATGAALCLVAAATPITALPLGAPTVAWQVGARAGRGGGPVGDERPLGCRRARIGPARNLILATVSRSYGRSCSVATRTPRYC